MTTLTGPGVGESVRADPLAVLRPESGLARGSSVVHDEDFGLWAWAVDVGLRDSRATLANGTGIVHVGAVGFQRASTLIRAAGEAVERFALIPPAQEPDRHHCVGPGHPLRADLRWRGSGRADGRLDEQPVDCLPGLAYDHRGPRPVLVPTALINDPAAPGDALLADPSPSGAAAGASSAGAGLAALLESAERDAAQSFWALQPRVPTFRGEVLHRLLAQARPDGVGLLEVLDEGSLDLSCLVIETDVPGLSCVFALLMDRAAAIVAAGAAIGADLAVTAARAGREALQVLSLLRQLRRGDPDTVAGPVVDELNRALFWSQPGSLDLVADVLRRCAAPVPADLLDRRAAPVRLPELIGALAARGLEPVLVDLDHRLPPAVRAGSWHAVKAVVRGHQPLRLNEAFGAGWCTSRLEQWAQVWDCDATPSTLPHPLI